MARFVSVLLVAVGVLLSCVLVTALLPVPTTKPPAPGETIPVATATPTQLPTPEPTEVVSSNVSLPAVYKASTVNVPAAYKLLSLVPLPPSPPSPAYIDLGTLGGPHSAALDVNNRGQVVGWSAVSADDQSSGEGHAFLWQNGKMRDLGTLGGRHSWAYYINEQGQIAGNSEYGADDAQHAFFWANGRMIDLGTLGGAMSMATDLNDLGQVIGTSSTAAGQTHCFLWAAGHMTDLGTLGGTTCNVVDINNRGQIVGDSTPTGATSDYSTHAFFWEKGTMTDLTPDLEPDRPSCAIAVNELSQVIGTRSYCSGGSPFLWVNGSVLELSSVGQGFVHLDTINDRGQVVGYGNLQCNCLPGMPPSYCCSYDALLWDSGALINLGIQERRWPNKTTLLNNRRQIVLGRTFWGAVPLYLWQDGALIPFEVPSGTSVVASAINDAGAVVGYGDHALLWQIVAATE